MQVFIYKFFDEAHALGQSKYIYFFILFLIAEINLAIFKLFAANLSTIGAI